ncbi:MAG: hypothetical protein AB1696_25910 [Planctomycetota bacterium]
MATNWNLIRDVMSRTIDACEAIENLGPDLFKGEYEARSDFQDDVCVGDFLNRFQRYPEGAQRDIIRIRSRLGSDKKYLGELAHALINTARACAESIGLPDNALSKEVSDLEPHCGSAGKSVQSQLKAIPKIQNGWILTGITKALEKFRKGKA